ncbi:hypothetical protein ADL12_12550 [Streptomyces regalis]|uniref:PknH-like extracellular domain-containing protein n=1 Tax=Streptomyces regalis TaxID=68262 RepID=A0A0X3V9E6_9ACTN|nr:hypothetical protein ADL12_12550 [Streptomyces regalis]
MASGGGGSSADDLGLNPITQATATALPGRLDEAALAGREAEGFTVTEAKAPAVRVSQNACAPAGYILSGMVIGKPASTVVRQASGEDTVVSVVLAEYEAEQAQPAMDALATAVDECAGGFTATVDGEERGFGKVALELAPEGTDQAMGLRAVVERAGVKTPVKAVALRKGNTVAYVSAVPEGSVPKDFAVPAAVVDAQLAKLS